MTKEEIDGLISLFRCTGGAYRGTLIEAWLRAGTKDHIRMVHEALDIWAHEANKLPLTRGRNDASKKAV